MGKTYVTIATPLERTQERMTWAGVAPRRFAAALTGLSTGPPGYRVIGLTSRSPVSASKGRKGFKDAREATVSFKKDVMFGSELDQVFMLVVVVRVEEDLLEVSMHALTLTRTPVLGLQRG